MFAAQVLMRLTSAWRIESALAAVLVPFCARICPLVCTVTLLPKLIAAPVGQGRFGPLIVTVAMVWGLASGPRFTVRRPIEEIVPIWLVVTTIAAPLPVAPGTTLLTLTFVPDCAPV